MFLKRHIAYPVVFFLLLILIGVSLLFLTSYLLPGFLESKIISILKKDAGISEFTLNFRELDLDGADLGPLRLGSPQNPALLIRSIQVDYSARELYQKKIKKIVASGVELYAEFKNGQLGLRGFDLEKLLNRLDSKKKKEKNAEDQSPLSFPERIEINNGTLVLILEETTYRLPFELVIVTEENATHILKAIARIYPRGQTVKISARLDFKQNRVASQLVAKDLDLLRFADLFKPGDALRISGSASLDANVDFQLTPLKVSAITGWLKGSAIDVRYENLEIQSLSDRPDNAKSLIIDFERSERQNWKIKLSDFAAVAPMAASVSDMAATVQPVADGYKIFGNFKLSFGSANTPANAAFPFRFIKPFDLPIKFSTHHAKNGTWRFDLANGDRKQIGLGGADFEYGQIHMNTKFPGVNLTANGSAGNIRVAYKLQIPDIHTTAGDVNIFSPHFVLTGETNMVPGRTPGSTSTINLDLSGSAMTVNATRIKANKLSANGTLRRNKAGFQDIDGIIRFANTRIEDTQRSIRLRKARGSIPFKFPAKKIGKKGIISIEEVSYQKLDLGSIKAHVQQTTSGMSFGGKLNVQFIPELSAKFLGESNFWGANDHETRAQFELFYPETGPEINLGKFLPAAEGFTFEGKFLEQGNLIIGKNGLYATAKSSLSNGKLRHRKNRILIEGIQMTLLIRNIAQMHSAPGQKLKFARASFGEMNIENGEIDFQIESARSVLIEKSHFSWCDGTVDAPAIRLKPGIEDYSLILYCDRLNLAKVLEQFGAASVEAEGELNGRIPIRYHNGQLSFHDGFLFTTPGETGKIRMTDTEILTAGIPPDTPQYVQMELARKALEDYDYSWAKLNLTTEGDDLLLNMQLDGKPAKSLPFVYRKDIGGFAKVEADVQGSTFQGIRLDVNFRLPLNKLMQYKELIQMIQQSRE